MTELDISGFWFRQQVPFLVPLIFGVFLLSLYNRSDMPRNILAESKI